MIFFVLLTEERGGLTLGQVKAMMESLDVSLDEVGEAHLIFLSRAKIFVRL